MPTEKQENIRESAPKNEVSPDVSVSAWREIENQHVNQAANSDPRKGETPDVLDFSKAQDPYSKEVNSPAQIQTPEQEAYLRASLGLEQIAPDAQVDSLILNQTRLEQTQALGLEPNATALEIETATQAKMRDNVGLPASATEEEFQQRLAEYNKLAETDSVGAHVRAELALPPSATAEEVAEASLRSIAASERAMLGLPQGATEAQVQEAFKNYSAEGLKTTLGLPANVSDKDLDQAIQAKVKENVGLPANATTTELSRRLAEYGQLAETDPVGAQMRADLGLAPSATYGEMLEAYGRQQDELRANK